MSTSETADIYDLPALYDIVHAPMTASDVRGLERIAGRFAAPSSRRRRMLWLEPACGTGRLLRHAARRGHRVVGLDLSACMVEYANRRFRSLGVQRRASAVVADMTDFDAGLLPRRADFALNLINTIRHLPGDRAVLDHLRVMRRALSPGAPYAVGIGLTAYGREQDTEDVWASARGRCRVTQVFQYLQPRTAREICARRERVVTHLTVERPRGVEHYDAGYPLRTYSRVQWEALLRRSAMEPIATVDERGRDVEPRDGRYAIWVLRAC